jgi:hypothetical protein
LFHSRKTSDGEFLFGLGVLLARYYALAFDQSAGSFTTAARRLGVDWRVVKRRLDQTFLETLRHQQLDSDDGQG